MTDNEIIDIDESKQQLLSFILAGQEFAIDILKVQEIREKTQTTLIPNSPNYIEGVMNLRGEIIPIVDLRKRFNLNDDITLIKDIVIVLKVKNGKCSRLIGLKVDSFSETYELSIKDIKPAPKKVSVIDDEFIIGLSQIENNMLILLDIDQLLSSKELAQ